MWVWAPSHWGAWASVFSAGPKPGWLVRVASGRASGVKRAKSMMRDRLAVATPDKGSGRKKKKINEAGVHIGKLLLLTQNIPIKELSEKWSKQIHQTRRDYLVGPHELLGTFWGAKSPLRKSEVQEGLDELGRQQCWMITVNFPLSQVTS